MAPYPGALTLNFRQSVPGKPPYFEAWSLNFRGCCPESRPKWSLILGAKNLSQDLHEVSAVQGIVYGGDRPKSTEEIDHSQQ
jgi:hypothetical protein